jgi:hypothetical protein
MRPAAFVIVLALFGGQAAAQPAKPATEAVTVTGTRSREVIQGFVQSFAAPVRLTGKIARWEDGICPSVRGLPAAYTKFLLQHVRDVAAAAGAPVNRDPSCKPNIQIVFTAKPQALLDDIRKKAPDFLGYLDNSAQRDRAATIIRPIQSWYMTQTVDVLGHPEVDSTHSGGLEIYFSRAQPPITIPHAHAAAVTGSRIADGIRSTFYQALIIADPEKLKDYEMGSLGDYIALLALAQLDAPDRCQQLPSIVNMLARDCADKSAVLTENDTAYLRGLYRMTPDWALRAQEDQIAYQMQQSLKGK